MLRRAPPRAAPAFVLALALGGAWAAVYPHTPDLAAQTYRTQLFASGGFGLYDAHWYGGHLLPGYSLLAPALGSLLGLRVMGVLCVLASTLLFATLAREHFGAGAGVAWGTGAFALAAAGDLWIGRLAFALGVSLALAAVFALRRGHAAAAAAAALACAAASPVAGVLLAFAALAPALARRRLRPLLVLALPVAFVVVPLALLFPEGGFEPFPLRSFIATVLVTVVVLAALPREQTLLRVGAALYLAACVLSLAVRTPMGSNVERYGVLLAAPLLLCARPRARLPAALALALALTWLVWGPVRETRAADSAATHASYYAPLERFLSAQASEPFRVEVPPTRSRWEVALLAPRVALARGWEKQLDERYDGVLLRSGLRPAAYLRWLREQAVTYVALPDAPLDPTSAQEGRLVRSGQPFLREVFTSAHWRVFRVLGAVALASGPGRLVALGRESVRLRARAPGSFLVRVHYTRYWRISQGAGCVTRARGGWTAVRVSAPGPVQLTAAFSLARAFGAARSCAAPGGGRRG